MTEYIPAREIIRTDRNRHVVHARATFGLKALCGVRAIPVHDAISSARLTFRELGATCHACKEELRRIDAARRESEGSK